jgi:hypothetical protein
LLNQICSVLSVIILFHELTGCFHEIHYNHQWPANSWTVYSIYFGVISYFFSTTTNWSYSQSSKHLYMSCSGSNYNRQFNTNFNIDFHCRFVCFSAQIYVVDLTDPVRYNWSVLLFSINFSKLMQTTRSNCIININLLVDTV